MTQTITTVGGQTITDITLKYVVRETSTMHVFTDVCMRSGVQMHGPTFTKAEWAKLQKAQAAKAKFATELTKYSRWYKQSRYAIVNSTASGKQIDRWIGFMDAAKKRMDAAEATVRSFGIEQY